MRPATLFMTALVLGLLVSRSSLAQSGYAPLEPAPVPPPTPVPPGYHVERQVRVGPLATGAVMASIGYSLGFILAESACHSDRWFFLPVAGALVGVVSEPEHVTSGPCDDPEGIRHAARTWSAVLQGVGGPLILFGAAYPRIEIVADNPKRHARGGASRTFAVAPALGTSSASVVVIGSF
jgi:hypothetical protein